MMFGTQARPGSWGVSRTAMLLLGRSVRICQLFVALKKCEYDGILTINSYIIDIQIYQ